MKWYISGLPQKPPAPCINCLFGIFEIKTLNDDFDNIEKGKASVYKAMEQTYDYARRVSTPAFSLPEFGLQVVLSYIVYGRYYTKVTLSIDLEVGHIWDVKPW